MDHYKHQKNIFQSLRNTGKNIYHMTPDSIRCLLKPIRYLYKFCDEFLLDTWIIGGKEISSGHDLAIIYAGRAIDKNYFANLAYGDSFQQNYMGKKWLGKILSEIEHNRHSCSLVIVQVPHRRLSLSEKMNCFYIPGWVSAKFDVLTVRNSVFKNSNSSLKSDLSKIKKNKLTFEVTNEMSRFVDFYNNMYEPYINQIYGDKTLSSNYDFVKRQFGKRGIFKDLLLVKKDDEYVAGALLNYEGKWAKLATLGIKDGNMQYVKDGAIGAIYYFSMRYFEENGFETISLGGSRPFLKDGVLRYKKKWRPTLSHHTDSGFIVKMLKEAEGAKGFFLNNPFIFEDACGFKEAIFIDNSYHLSEEDFELFDKNYYQPGVKKMMIYRFSPSNSSGHYPIPASLSDKIVVEPVSEVFKTNSYN